MAKKHSFVCNGKTIEVTPVVEENESSSSHQDLAVRAPGGGDFIITEPELSVDSITPAGAVKCRVSVNGKNIRQISSEWMLKVKELQIGPFNRDFLRSPEDREVRGLRHPHWEAENALEFESAPTINLLYCGEGFTLACMQPEIYGAEIEEQIWSLEGVYQRGGGEPFRARLEFNHLGALVKKTGFYPIAENGVVSPFELFIEDGDTFEPYVSLIRKDGKEGLGIVNAVMLGGGNQLHIETASAPAGIYQVGVRVEDFDGKTSARYSALTVE